MLRWRYLPLEEASGETEGRKETYASDRKCRDPAAGVYERIKT